MATSAFLSSPLRSRTSPPINLSARCRLPEPPSPSTTLKTIQSSGVIACLRAKSCEQALEAARAALQGGISVLEVMMPTPGVFEVVRKLIHEYPTCTIGVGTVLEIEDAKNAAEAGATFLMSPATVVEILEYTHGTSVLYIPGVMTPTEAVNAFKMGARVVKVYPVSVLGGPYFISAIKRSLLHLPIIASQGISMDSLQTYLDVGASAVTLSDAIFEKEAMRTRNFGAIRQLAQTASSYSRDALRRKNETAT